MSNKKNIVCLDTLDISAVADWWQEAAKILTSQTQSPVCVNASSVQRVDTAGLQALLMLFTYARQRQIEISWDKPSDALRHAAKLSGLEQSLQLSS